MRSIPPSASMGLIEALRQAAASGPRHTVRILGGDAFPCGEAERLLEAMERMGGRDVHVGCRRGGCGVCRVRVLEGTFEAEAMSTHHISRADRARGYALACCIRPTSDLLVAPAFKKRPHPARRGERRSDKSGDVPQGDQ